MRYFDAVPNAGYHYPRTDFRSYFLTFADGARLELMNKSGMSDEPQPAARTGYAHIAFSVGRQEQVDALTASLNAGGSGVHSFDETYPLQMPTALEAGTLNVHGLAGLCAGARWLLEQGVENLAAREAALARLFYEQVRTTPGETV